MGYGMRITGHDNVYTSQQTHDILVENNLFDDLNYANGQISPRAIQLSSTAEGPILNLTIQNNLALFAGDCRE